MKKIIIKEQCPSCGAKAQLTAITKMQTGDKQTVLVEQYYCDVCATLYDVDSKPTNGGHQLRGASHETEKLLKGDMWKSIL